MPWQNDLTPEAPEYSARSWWSAHWDTGLLSLVILALLLMLGYVLWPSPRAVLTLRPASVSPRAETVVATESARLSEPAELTESAARLSDGASASTSGVVAHQAASRRRHESRHPKKPEHPPVLNLNTASVAQLQLLHGIGPKMAERIVEYRHSHGPFSAPEQVMDVKGIGAKKFEKIKPYLRT